MLEKSIKAITVIAPFLAPYPLWVKILVVIWVFLGAGVALALVLFRPVDSNVKADAPPRVDSGAVTLTSETSTTGSGASSTAVGGSSTSETSTEGTNQAYKEVPPSPSTHPGVWLTIEGVDAYGQFDAEKIGIHVIATVNGVECVYPSRDGIMWMSIGPDMSKQRFRLPDSPTYRLHMTARILQAGVEHDLVSQDTPEISRSSVPRIDKYRLYKKINESGTVFPGAQVAVEVRYSVTASP